MTSTAHMPQVTPKCPSVVTLLEVVGPRAVCLWVSLWPFHVFAGPQALGCAAAGLHEVPEHACPSSAVGLP